MYEFTGSEASGVSEGAARHYAHTKERVEDPLSRFA